VANPFEYEREWRGLAARVGRSDRGSFLRALGLLLCGGRTPPRVWRLLKSAPETTLLVDTAAALCRVLVAASAAAEAEAEAEAEAAVSHLEGLSRLPQLGITRAMLDADEEREARGEARAAADALERRAAVSAEAGRWPQWTQRVRAALETLLPTDTDAGAGR
jgi:hypothetical protein